MAKDAGTGFSPHDPREDKWFGELIDGWMNFQNSLTCFDFVSILTAVQLKTTFPLSLFVILLHYTCAKPMKIKKLMKVSSFFLLQAMYPASTIHQKGCESGNSLTHQWQFPRDEKGHTSG